MRRLVLLCLAAVAATSAYELVMQEITLTGGLITSDKITCDNIANLHIGSDSYNIDCHDSFSKDDPKKLEARKIVYTDRPITTKANSIGCDLELSDQSKITFSIKPNMNKVGQSQGGGDDAKYTPLTPATASTTPAVPTTGSSGPDCDKVDKDKDVCVCKDATKKDEQMCIDYCAKDENKPKDECFCQHAENHDACVSYCKVTSNSGLDACKSPTIVKVSSTAVKNTVPRLQPSDAAAAESEAAAIDTALPAAIRIRGPGPVRLPVRHSPSEYTLVKITEPIVEEDEEERRVRRAAAEDPPAVDDTTIHVAVTFYILDEAGNPAAVWAAVIEGIILIVLVGLCFWFFFWAPRARAAASAAQDPYKEGPSYSVSYANSSYNNQRIDAFQNPPTPAAPPRPANSAYMEDYITDNIGAMSASGGNGQSAAPAATPAAAASAFEPRHQRFDSSGLVTVNLS